jgi:hypothetical protein
MSALEDKDAIRELLAEHDIAGESGLNPVGT